MHYFNPKAFAAGDDLVGRAPWPAADPLVDLHLTQQELDEGVQRGRWRPPHVLIAAMPLCGAALQAVAPISSALLEARCSASSGRLKTGCRMKSCPTRGSCSLHIDSGTMGTQLINNRVGSFECRIAAISCSGAKHATSLLGRPPACPTSLISGFSPQSILLARV